MKILIKYEYDSNHGNGHHFRAYTTIETGAQVPALLEARGPTYRDAKISLKQHVRNFLNKPDDEEIEIDGSI